MALCGKLWQVLASYGKLRQLKATYGNAKSGHWRVGLGHMVWGTKDKVKQAKSKKSEPEGPPRLLVRAIIVKIDLT